MLIGPDGCTFFSAPDRCVCLCVLLKHHLCLVCSLCVCSARTGQREEGAPAENQSFSSSARHLVRRFPHRCLFFTLCRSTIKTHTDVCSYCEQPWSVIFHFVSYVFILFFSLLCSVFGNKQIKTCLFWSLRSPDSSCFLSIFFKYYNGMFGKSTMPLQLSTYMWDS